MRRTMVVVVACTLASFANAQPKKQEPAVDYAAIADKVVGKTAAVKEDDIVVINFGPNELAFAEELALAIAKRGAHPLLSMWSENLERRWFSTVPEKYDSRPPLVELALAKLANVNITIPQVRDTSIYASMSPARRAASLKRFAPVNELLVKRGVRFIELDNGLAPDPTRAKELGMTEPELAKIYWDGLAADYTAIEAKALALQEVLAKGTELHITHPNGTDLKVKIKGRKVKTSDGVISPADLKAKNTFVWLPAGELTLTPVPGTANGKLVDDRLMFEGKEVTGLAVEIKNGKVTNIGARTNWDAIKGLWDAGGKGKDELGVINFGINPAVKTTPKLEPFASAGMLALAIGQNVTAGGTNAASFSLYMFLPGTTVMLDGKPLVENGVLK